MKNITKIGNLTILEKIDKNNNKNKAFYRCLCDCGNEINLIGKSIFRNVGAKTNCGCLPRKNVVDLKNKRFGKLLAIEYIGTITENGLTKCGMWKCQCDCGSVVNVRGDSLRRGATNACGCIHRLVGANNKKWSGCGDFSGKFWSHIKVHARKRNIIFNITKEYAWDLFLQQNRKCSLTGINLTFLSKLTVGTASLDRIDSSKGYIEGNVQWIHKDINKMKWDLKQEEFIEYCKKVSFYDQIRY